MRVVNGVECPAHDGNFHQAFMPLRVLGIARYPASRFNPRLIPVLYHRTMDLTKKTRGEESRTRRDFTHGSVLILNREVNDAIAREFL